MVASSLTLSPNGRAAMASASCSSSLALLAVPTRTSPTSPGLNTYRWTPSSSAARSLAACPQPACSPPSSRSDRTLQTPTKENMMETRINEVANRIYRLSTFVPDIGPTGFTFNQYLIDDDEPLLFHTGPRAMFPLVAEAISTITPPARLRCLT